MSLPEKEKILIQNAILKQINEIDLSLSQVGETATVDLDQSRMGRLSRVDAIFRQEMALQQRENMKNRKGDLQQALFQLKRNSDSFGFCIDCEDLISIPRLVANPSAKRCIECQTDYEE